MDPPPLSPFLKPAFLIIFIFKKQQLELIPLFDLNPKRWRGGLQVPEAVYTQPAPYKTNIVEINEKVRVETG